MPDILIKNALLSGKTCDILVENGKISSVEDSISCHAGRVIDQHGNLVIPGFVDCHTHLDKSHLNDKRRTDFVHGTGAVKGGLTREAKALFTAEDIFERAERTVQHAISCGTLVMRTNCDVDAIVGLKGIEALLELKEKYRDIITLQIAAFAQEGVFQDGKTPGLLEEALKMGADLVGGHTITCGEGERHIDFILELAEKYCVEADFHLDESGSRANYLLPYMAEAVIDRGLGGRVNAIHMCTLSALDEAELSSALSLIKESGLKATVAPTAISSRSIAPVKRLLDMGIPLGLGSDNIRDFFNPLGSGDIKQAALLLSYLQAFFTRDEVSAVWHMLTDSGAKVLGVDDYAVSVGNRANLTLFNTPDHTDIIANQTQPHTLIRSGRLV